MYLYKAVFVIILLSWSLTMFVNSQPPPLLISCYQYYLSTLQYCLILTIHYSVCTIIRSKKEMNAKLSWQITNKIDQYT